MKLRHLKEPWNRLTRRSRLAIIDKSNQRRIQAFEENKSSKKSKKKKSSSKKKRQSKKRTPSTPEEVMALKEKMSEEEWENFKLMLNMDE